MVPTLSPEIAAEQALIARARTDREAFGLLYDRYVDRIYRYALRRTGGHSDAEDLTARTFTRALERLDRYEDRGLPFGAWLYRIARNLWIDDHRRDGRALSLDGLREAGKEPPDDGVPPELLTLEQETVDAAWAAVAALPPMQRRAITLSIAQGRSHAETGRIIGRSEAATKQLVYRGVKTVRVRLAALEEAGDA